MLELRCRCEGHAVDSQKSPRKWRGTLWCVLSIFLGVRRFTWCVSLGVCSCPDAWMEEAAAAGPRPACAELGPIPTTTR